MVFLRILFVGLSAMKDRSKKRSFLLPWRAFCLVTLFIVFVFGSTLSALQLFSAGVFLPNLMSAWLTPAIKAVTIRSTALPAISIQESVIFPDQVLVFLKYLPTSLFTKDEISCVFFYPNSSEPLIELPPKSTETDNENFGRQIVRCPLPLPGFVVVSLAVKPKGHLPAGPTYRWDSLAYEAMIDRDNTTLVFVKGLNLRSGRASNTSMFKCVYGWDFRKPKFMLQSEVVSIAQEIVRCKTPSSLLKSNSHHRIRTNSIKVSVRRIGRRQALKSIARPERRLEPSPAARKHHQMCICTMLWNQARFLREWVIYHSRIGVKRWFIYDNNSSDDIGDVIKSLIDADYNITRHVWPWIKTQEAGFAHCALLARDHCEWVGFIDVDEFLHFPSGLLLNDVLRNESRHAEVAELRVSCHSFGPSGLEQIPAEGVTVGYTCRMSFPERHKSIVRPETLNDTLINVVHHFDLKAGFKDASVGRNILVINHYKYQVWEVFKEKFYRRVATYVSDWQQEQNVGSKDRTPGLGTKAVEPPDWASKFCEVNDTGLRDRVLDNFTDPITGMLPWQDPRELSSDAK